MSGENGVVQELGLLSGAHWAQMNTQIRVGGDHRGRFLIRGLVSSHHHHQFAGRRLGRTAGHGRVENPEPEPVGCFFADLGDLLRRHRAVAHDDGPGRHGVRCTTLTKEDFSCAVRVEDAGGQEVQSNAELGDRVGDHRPSLTKRFQCLLATRPHDRLVHSALYDPFGDGCSLAAETHETHAHRVNPLSD